MTCDTAGYHQQIGQTKKGLQERALTAFTMLQKQAKVALGEFGLLKAL